MSAEDSKLDEVCVNTIRCVAIDMVQEANSGHPGMPLGMAPAAHILFSRFLRFSSKNSSWPNRDRFVLSNGHGCALLYTMLHLCGYKVSMDDLKAFRQRDSITPGHPESHVTDGVEMTTGPLGQGFANAVGLAIAREHAAAKYNKDDIELIDHRVYAFCGDGCLQEGVAAEAASLAGHLKLKNLIVIYDDNNIQIDGDTNKTFTEDVPARFQAYGWKTLTVDKAGNGDTDRAAFAAAIDDAIKNSDKPVLISLKTIIGYGAGNKGTTVLEGTADSHGSPLGAESIEVAKTKFGMPVDQKFYVPGEVSDYYAQVASNGADAEAKWNETFVQYKAKYNELGEEFERIFVTGELPKGWKDGLSKWGPKAEDEDALPTSEASRSSSGKVLNALAARIPELIGGSADLTGSNKTALNGEVDFQADTPGGRYLRYGVREFAMAAIGNAMSCYGYIPFSATFLNFITYAWGAVRLGALSELRHIYIMTHDSIFLGEDGPTHQPVEVLPLLRATPNLVLLRPADCKETAGAYIVALENKTTPTVIALSRQNLPTLALSDRDKVAKGAYVVVEEDNPDIILIASGSEVSLAKSSADELCKDGVKARVVSCPSTDLFAKETVEYRRETLLAGVPVVSIEASSHFGWAGFSHFHVGMDTFGASAPGKHIGDMFGFTTPKVVERCKEFLVQAKKYPLGVLECQREY